MNRKQMLQGLMMVVAVFGIALTAQANGRLTPLPLETQVKYGATHVIEIDTADLAGMTTAATALAFTNTVSKPCSVKFQGYVLDQAFDSTAAHTNSIAVSVGTTTSTTKWINGLQAAYDQTPTVYASFGTDYTVTVADTNSAATVTSPILNAQTSDVSIVVTIGSPGANNALSEMVRGKVRAFFKILP